MSSSTPTSDSSSGRSIGVAVIGAGMAGRAHIAGYRTASSLYGGGLPEVRLVAVADAHAPFAEGAARRWGYAKAVTSWQEVAEDPEVDAVSVVVANSLHREVVEGLLAAGKHVLCEKPLAPSVEDAEAMVAAAERAAAEHGSVSGVGFTFRRSPAIGAVQRLVADGSIGALRHVDGRYWCDYAVSPEAPMSWRYQGGPGSGALADIGSHLVDLAEFLGGDVTSVRGTTFTTVHTSRPEPVGVVMGHARGEVSEQRAPVENEDLGSFTATLASGATATLTASRISHGHANGLGLTVFCDRGAAVFDLERAAELLVSDDSAPTGLNGYRQVLVGPEHPYLAGGLAMDFPSVGHGQNDFFTFQCRAFLEQIAGGSSAGSQVPPLLPLSHGLHNLRVLDAVTRAAQQPGTDVPVR